MGLDKFRLNCALIFNIYLIKKKAFSENEKL